MSHVREIFVSNGKNESTNVGLAHDHTKFFKSGVYFHTIELENILSGNPKLSGSMKKRVIYFDLMIRRDAKETKRDESILETRAKLFNPCWNL